MKHTLIVSEHLRSPHFEARVRERLWPTFGPIDPEVLWNSLREYIPTGHKYLTFEFRISKDGKRLWRVDVPPIGHFYCVVKHTEQGDFPMTVLLPGMKVSRQGRGTVVLE